MKTVNIVDYIGNKTGMHYYNHAFAEIIGKISNVNIRILSIYNSEGGTVPFLKNQFNGNIVQKISNLFLNYWRFYRYIKRNPDDLFIYLTYGNVFDIPFLYILSKAKNHIVDIHEAIAQNIDNKEMIKNQYRNLYSRKIKAVISHSDRTDSFMHEFGFKGKKFNVPHFKYQLDKVVNAENVSEDIMSSIVPEKTNILFFGNITYDKGIDLFIESVNKLSDNEKSRLNVIIAGKDFDGAINNVRIENPELFHLILRRIEDDELKYLYNNVQYIALPYRKTSQSGVLEMAFHFKVPIIASDIPYFHTTLNEFSSFGILGSEDYTLALAKALSSDRNTFFKTDEYDKYTNRKEQIAFEEDFAQWLNKL